MDLKRMTSKAKDMVDKRGGTGNLKEDAGELKSIAKGQGSLKDKAKAAMEAIKEPGAGEEAEAPATADAPPPSGAPAPASDVPPPPPASGE